MCGILIKLMSHRQEIQDYCIGSSNPPKKKLQHLVSNHNNEFFLTHFRGLLFYLFFAVRDADDSFPWLKLCYSLLKLKEFDAFCCTTSGSVNRPWRRSNSKNENQFNLLFTKTTDGEKICSLKSFHFLW